MTRRPAPRLALLVAAAATGTLLAGCASTPAAPPTFDPQASAKAQAATFIGDNGKTKHLSGVKKVAVTGCNVLFAETSSAHAGTSGGIFSEVGNTVRAEAKVSVLYTLNGVSDAQMQVFANEICADAENRLKSAGFDIVPTAELLANDSFKALLGSGKASPLEFKAPGKGSKTTYKVFAPTGYTVYDPRYIGVGGGLAQAFKAAGGNSTWQHEGRVMQQLGASAVNISIVVDFAQLQSSGQARAMSLASQDTAEVKHGVNLGISGQIEFKPADQLKCWERFGKQECMLNANTSPIFTSKNPVTTSERFYKEVVDTTTTGDKVTAGFTKALSVLSAMGGVGGVASHDITRYSVEVDAAQFAKVSRDGANGFLDMVFLTARQ
ncbi:MAG TPA: hypothetical protein VGE57_10325 [Solimonas sp.]